MYPLEQVIGSDLRLFAIFAITIPLLILIFGMLLYHYKPKYRLANGIALLILASLELPLYPSAYPFYSSTWMYGITDMVNTKSTVLIIIIILDILTFYVGITSLRKRVTAKN